jgi:hypothetical protein
LSGAVVARAHRRPPAAAPANQSHFPPILNPF